MSKISYLLRSIRNLSKDVSCPYCCNEQSDVVEKKYIVTKLVRCNRCSLQYRTPKDDQEFLKKFYQTDYKVDVQMMTTLPSDKELEILKRNNFEKLRDYYPIVSNFTTPEKNKIIDYGCSWGYNLYKFNIQGLDSQGYELSEPRAKYGKEKLGVDLVCKEFDIRKSNDVFFSSHVIEHLADIGSFVEKMQSVLTAEGISITICPNGSPEFKKRNPTLFSFTWGQLHPNYIDVNFMQHVFKNNPYYIATGDDVYDLEQIRAWDGISQVTNNDRLGFELLVVAKPNITLK